MQRAANGRQPFEHKRREVIGRRSVLHLLSPTSPLASPNGTDLAPPTTAPGPGGGFFAYIPDVTTSLIVFGAYFLIGALAAVLIYARRELVS